MRHICVCLLLCLAPTLSLGQDSRADLFVGYSYLNIDTNGLTARQSANGWEASVSGNFNKWLAVEGDVSGYYKNYDVLGIGISVRDYFYGAGPRINFKPVFLHALIGGDHLIASALGLSASEDRVAGALGGGIQWNLSPALSFRSSADYALSRHDVFGGSVTQNNVRVSVGLVYSFGARTDKVADSQSANPGIPISVLGVTVIAGRNRGAEIAKLSPSSPAESCGLRVGDVINAVDGKVIETPNDLAAELANRAAGSRIKVEYLIHGIWQGEVFVLLGSPRSTDKE